MEISNAEAILINHFLENFDDIIYSLSIIVIPLISLIDRLYVKSYLPTVNSWNVSAQNVGGSTLGPADYTIFRSLLETWNFWSLVVGIFTFVLLIYLVIRFREVSPDDSNIDSIAPGVFPKERDNLTLELTWFIVPTILVLYLTFIAWQSMITVWVDPYSEEGADDAFDITIEAYQWGWNFYYHDEIQVLNETEKRNYCQWRKNLFYANGNRNKRWSYWN